MKEKRAREQAEKPRLDFRQCHNVPSNALVCPPTTMRYTSRPPDVPDDARQRPSSVSHPHQPYDAFLVLDVEATCFRGTGFDYPNEIIVRIAPFIKHP